MHAFFEISNLKQVYQQHPESLVFAHLAAALLHKNEYQQALEIAETGVQKHSRYPFGHFVLGLCYYHLNDFMKARNHLEISLAYDEKNLKAWKLLGVITEKLDLPAHAKSARVNYYLLDSFNPDALAGVAMQEPQAPEIEFTSSIEAELTPGEDVTAEKIYEGENLDEADFDDLFKEAGQTGEEIDFSQKVEEVFKESLGDIGSETDLERLKEDDQPVPPAEGGAEDQAGSKETASAETADGEAAETTGDAGDAQQSPAGAPAEEDNPFAGIDMIEVEDDHEEAGTEEVDISAELDDFFAEYDSDVDEAGQPAPDPDADPGVNFGNIIFDASVEDDPEQGGGSPPDDLLDFSAIVDDILAEEEGEEPGQEAEDTEEQDLTEPLAGQETPPTIEDGPPDEKHSGPQATELRESPDQLLFPESEAGDSPSPADAPPEQPFPEIRPGKFGSPPILSPTLGEIYIAQGRFEEALGVFEKLLEKEPGNRRFNKKVEDIRKMVEKQKSS